MNVDRPELPASREDRPLSRVLFERTALLELERAVREMHAHTPGDRCCPLCVALDNLDKMRRTFYG